ncbi:MAG: hypothetical protein HFE46_03540 [Clostridia bacterium]|nr:hypothetical protein [Clostridia bacterium]
MYKKALVSLGAGELCQASASGAGVVAVVRENGRMVRRQLLLPGGKSFGARVVSYADAYFEFPFAALEILGEEILYADKASVGA